VMHDSIHIIAGRRTKFKQPDVLLMRPNAGLMGRRDNEIDAALSGRRREWPVCTEW